MFKTPMRALSVLLMIILGLGGPAQGQDTSDDIEQIIEQSRASGAYWSVIARDTTGAVLSSYNAQKQVRPASNLKLLISAAILDELGPDFRYTTKVYGWGQQQGQTWDLAIS
ncbi:MAG: D-alanyl-D-alanine carboxypeptidase [Fodinibius sp.]|nr:D-alanyl-D-alanine carboxypeptidase [Fodinibius sp.]